MSRRAFLAGMAAIAGTGVALGPAAPDASAAELAEYIPATSLRPRPRTQVLMAILRIPPPYWLGWPGTFYDVEAHSAEYTKEFRRVSHELGIAPTVERAPLEGDDGVAQFIARAQREKPDAVLLVLQHMSGWGWAERIASALPATIIFSPVGTAFTGHVLNISRRPGVHVVSSLEIEGMKQALRMVRAKRQMEETRVLVIAGDQRDEAVLPTLGVKVRRIPRRTFQELFNRMPVTDETRQLADELPRVAKKVVEPTREGLMHAARTFQTAKALLKMEGANAMSMDCLGMVGARVVPTPPCMAFSLLQDSGVTAGCEADLFGAVSLMFVSYLLDRPGYMNDPVPETVKNRLVAAHCTCGTRIRGFDQPPVPFILRTHSESDLGVAPQVLWPVGEPCSLIRLQGPSEVLLDTGTVTANVDTPPAGGCRTSVEIQMDDVEDSRDVLGFHQVVTYGNQRRNVDAYAQMYGLTVTHSPERAPEPEGGR